LALVQSKSTYTKGVKKYVYKRSEGSLLWHNVIYILFKTSSYCLYVCVRSLVGEGIWKSPKLSVILLNGPMLFFKNLPKCLRFCKIIVLFWISKFLPVGKIAEKAVCVYECIFDNFGTVFWVPN